MPDVRSSTGVPDARTVSASSSRSASLGAGVRRRLRPRRAAVRARPAARPGRSADHLDRVDAAPASSGRFAIRRLPTPAWTVITVSVWATTSWSGAADAYPLLADLLAGGLSLGGSLALGLLGQTGHVTPARRHAISDEPPGRERQEAHDGPAHDRSGPFRRSAYSSAAPKITAAASTARIDSRRGDRRQRPRCTQTRRAPRSPEPTWHPSPSARRQRRWPGRGRGSGHRLPNAITGTHSRTARAGPGPCACLS